LIPIWVENEGRLQDNIAARLYDVVESIIATYYVVEFSRILIAGFYSPALRIPKNEAKPNVVFL
jgi:hypothetical protein